MIKPIAKNSSRNTRHPFYVRYLVCVLSCHQCESLECFPPIVRSLGALGSLESSKQGFHHIPAIICTFFKSSVVNVYRSVLSSSTHARTIFSFVEGRRYRNTEDKYARTQGHQHHHRKASSFDKLLGIIVRQEARSSIIKGLRHANRNEIEH